MTSKSPGAEREDAGPSAGRSSRRRHVAIVLGLALLGGFLLVSAVLRGWIGVERLDADSPGACEARAMTLQAANLQVVCTCLPEQATDIRADLDDGSGGIRGTFRLPLGTVDPPCGEGCAFDLESVRGKRIPGAPRGWPDILRGPLVPESLRDEKYRVHVCATQLPVVTASHEGRGWFWTW